MTDQSSSVLSVKNLSVDINLPIGTLHAVTDVSFSVAAGETLCIVGESGSGKSMTALAVMDILPPAAMRQASHMDLEGLSLLDRSPDDLKKLLGNRMAMIFQDPMTSFNPVYRLGDQLEEVYLHHKSGGRREARERAEYLLSKVGIAAASERLRQYPHQLSGGLRQRMMIAMSLMCEPALLFADEPTTALDVTMQAQTLQLLDNLRLELNMGLVLITHDFGVVAHMADRVIVMYAGEIVEQGTARQIIDHPQHPYTQGLLACLPGQHGVARQKLASIRGSVPSLIGEIEGCRFHRRCDHAVSECATDPIDLHASSSDHSYRCRLVGVTFSSPSVVSTERVVQSKDDTQKLAPSDTVLECEGLGREFIVGKRLFSKGTILQAVDDVTLSIKRGEIGAIVGESGSGKTTLARMLLGLLPPTAGSIKIDQQPISDLSQKLIARQVQPVFQDPYASLNPRMTIEATIMQPLEIENIGNRSGREHRVGEIMELVGLPRRLRYAYPSQLSGGQRQRVAICRALVLNPPILVCDEPTSALDVSIQAHILNLLQDLQDKLDLTYLMISHNLAVIEHLADWVAVMYLGRIVEFGPSGQIFAAPQHPYTQELLASALSLDASKRLENSDVGFVNVNPLDMPGGCAFHTRCPHANDLCRSFVPEPEPSSSSGFTSCFLYSDNPDSPSP